jgi:8-oxo-dGTP diphosphatase
LKRPSDDFLGGIYELPSGKVEEGETLLDALHREVNEETGLKIEKIKEYAGSFDYVSKSGKKTRQFNFIVTIKFPVNIVLQEHDNFVWASNKQLTKYAVTDSVKKILNLCFK